jgi:IS30 family transposase
VEAKFLALPDKLRHVTTFDNGQDFTEHERLSAAAGMAIDFAQPFRVVAAMEVSVNDRPRRRPGYRMPPRPSPKPKNGP